MALPAPCAWVCIVQNVPVPHALAIDLAQWRSEGSPPREPTRWHRDSWHRRLPAHSALSESLPLLLDRDTVTVHAQDVSGPEAAIRAFVAAMVWGYGPSGYGPYRTNRVLESNPDAPRRLLDTAEAVRERGPLAGFDVLAAAPLKYLGVAFSTKYLYYCSRAVSHLHDGRTAPILDSVMSRWMSSHAGVTFALTHDRDGYRRYVTLLEQWGAVLDLRADVVEERIYVSALGQRSLAPTAAGRPAEHTAHKALTQLAAALDALGLGNDARTELDSLEHLLTARTTP